MRLGRVYGRIIPRSRGTLEQSRGIAPPVEAPPSEAEPLIRHALAVRQKSAFGARPSHGRAPPQCSRDLALPGMRRLGEAEPLFRRALAIHEASSGPDQAKVSQATPTIFRVLLTNKPAVSSRPNRSVAARSRSMRRAMGRIIRRSHRRSTISRRCSLPDEPRPARPSRFIAGRS